MESEDGPTGERPDTSHEPAPDHGPSLDPVPRHAWSVGNFRRVWAATVLFALGNWTERIVVGFVVLTETDSVFLTAATFAARQTPGVVVAPIAGSIVDRWPRNRVIGVTAVYKLLIVCGLAATAGADEPAIWIVFVLTALSGVGLSFEIPATQGLVTDSVPPDLRMNAVAVQSVGARGVGAAGGLVSGLAIDRIGSPAALGVGVAAFVTAAVASLAIEAPPAAAMPADAPRQRGSGWRLLRQSYLDLRLLLGMTSVRTLLLVAVVVEVFGFAFGALLPSVSVDVLGTAGTGLGALNMMASLGSLGGVVALSFLGDHEHKERLLIVITLLFGIFLALFASSELLPLSLVLIAGVGMSAGAFDTMQWILLQRNAPEDMRGRVVAGWVFAIGFGWLGHLGLGALGEWIGVQWALGGAGLLVLATGLALWSASGRLRPEAEVGNLGPM